MHLHFGLKYSLANHQINNYERRSMTTLENAMAEGVKAARVNTGQLRLHEQ